MDVKEPSKFRQIFNRLKNIDCSSINDLPDVVVDFDSSDDNRILKLPGNDVPQTVCFDGFNDPSDWSRFTLKGMEDGLLVVRGILSETTCKKWFSRLLDDWPVSQASVLKSHLPLPLSFKDKKDLRWMTFGYHHDWKTKVYDMENHDPIPSELVKLISSLSRLLNLDMRPEAGIINYYDCRRCRLSPHRDISELNYTAPLVSISLGSPAMFMVGGNDEDEEPVYPLLVKNGDVVIMGGARRLAYHAVPKVFCSDEKCIKQITRININARQVF